jgi:hypothetical protein
MGPILLLKPEQTGECNFPRAAYDWGGMRGPSARLCVRCEAGKNPYPSCRMRLRAIEGSWEVLARFLIRGAFILIMRQPHAHRLQAHADTSLSCNVISSVENHEALRSGQLPNVVWAHERGVLDARRLVHQTTRNSESLGCMRQVS